MHWVESPSIALAIVSIRPPTDPGVIDGEKAVHGGMSGGAMLPPVRQCGDAGSEPVGVGVPVLGDDA
jgi:hypothetical protein